MGLRVYNTLTRQKEPFEPLELNNVKMYVCGPNLYGPCHVGHAMSYLSFDMIKRYLQYRGYNVIHVQNFTDVEDRIIATARSQGTTIGALAEIYIDRFYKEMDGLNIKRADFYPRATEVIPKMIEIISTLIAKGHAYELDGDVYFRVTSDPDYGKLSRRTLEEMLAGARIEVDERKEHPMDFALWKASKPGEPAWDSPWGPGRPGWHIECSAMAIQFLGEQIDIHGGGPDVIFPHHENEIAQSESYTGKVPFVKYWLHNGPLRLREEEEKMTRHLGNFISCREALELYQPDAIRLFLLSSHYRSPITWKDDGVRAAERGLERMRAALRDMPDVVPASGGNDALSDIARQTKAVFIEAMDDDFNSPRAISGLFELTRAINQAREEGVSVESLAFAQGVLKELAGVLGLTLKEPEVPMQAEPFIQLLVDIRSELRAAKQWALADRIRARLAELDVALEDGPQGTRWRFVKR